jgi:hypothetical protein
MLKDRRNSFPGRRGRVPCNAGGRCPKCSLFQVIGLRFRAFQEQFGRDPGPNEPLFFDPEQDHPVQVEVAQAIDQIQAAARTLKIDTGAVLNFLKLSAGTRNKQNQSGPDATSLSRRPLPGSSSNKQQRREPSAGTPANPAYPGRSRHCDLYVVPDCRTERPSKRRAQSGTVSAWTRFVKEERTHGRHHVTKAEWALLSKVAMMGEPLNSRDFIFILDTIRRVTPA